MRLSDGLRFARRLPRSVVTPSMEASPAALQAWCFGQADPTATFCAYAGSTDVTDSTTWSVEDGVVAHSPLWGRRLFHGVGGKSVLVEYHANQTAPPAPLTVLAVGSVFSSGLDASVVSDFSAASVARQCTGARAPARRRGAAIESACGRFMWLAWASERLHGHPLTVATIAAVGWCGGRRAASSRG